MTAQHVYVCMFNGIDTQSNRWTHIYT